MEIEWKLRLSDWLLRQMGESIEIKSLANADGLNGVLILSCDTMRCNCEIKLDLCEIL